MEKIEAGTRVRLARRTASIKDSLPVGALGTVVAVENGIVVSWDGWTDGWSRKGFPEDSVWALDRDLLEVVGSKGSTWKPREGDKVIITKSSTNWAQDMNKYDGQTVVVTEVSRAENGKTTIRFDGDESWQWVLEDGHFKRATNYTLLDTSGSTTSNEDDLFILTKSGDKLRVGDRVIITKGTSAWNSSMERLIGRWVEISKINRGDSRDVNSRSIEFEGDGGWYWRYDYGHFMGEKEYYYTAPQNYIVKSDNPSDIVCSDDLFSGRAKSNITEEEISALSEVVKFNF